MTRYIRFQQGVNSKGALIPYDQTFIDEEVKKYPNSDWYRSLYQYEEDAKNYFESKDSIRGFKGGAYTNSLIFDFDSKENTELARADAIELLNRLQTLDEIDVSKSASAFFSGRKGFHIELVTNREFNPDDTKMICSALCTGLKTFDTSIYNTTRLFRIPNTKHQTTKLYKIELGLDDLVNLSMEDILEIAKTPNKALETPEPCDGEKLYKTHIETAKLLYAEMAKSKQVIVDTEEVEGIRGLDLIDFDKCPKNKPRCVYALEHGIMVPGQGERNELFRALAVYNRNQGFDKETTHNILKSIARKNAILYPESEAYTKEEIWNTVIASAFSGDFKQIPGATGISADNPHIKRYCNLVGQYTDKLCTLHNKANKTKSTVQIEEVSNSFNKFASNFDKNTVRTGIKLIDNYMNIAIGTVTLVAGASGSGKTSLCLEVLENCNKTDQHSVFFSLDMHKNLVYLKLATKLTQYTQKQIMQFYKENNQEKKEEIKAIIKRHYGNVFFDFSGTLTMEQMRDKVLDIEQQNGVKIKMVLVDYASRISGPYSDKHANASYNALKSTEVADVTDAAWIIIAQVARQSGNGSTPLRSKRVAKDSGDWEEAASNVITVWRPFMGIEGKDDIMRLFLAKNRMGRELERPLNWNGAKGKIWDMTDIELEQYSVEREPEEKELFKNKFSGGR